MALASVDVAVKVRGTNKLDQLIKRMDRVEQESRDVKKTLEQAFNRSSFQGIDRGTASLARFEREALDANKALKKLKASGASVAALNLSVAGAGAAGAGVVPAAAPQSLFVFVVHVAAGAGAAAAAAAAGHPIICMHVSESASENTNFMCVCYMYFDIKFLCKNIN